MTRDADALALAERMLAILGDGSFAATYKFALVVALLDVCIENTSKYGEPPSSITTRQLAERVLELYWRHATTYRGDVVLRQGGGRLQQAAVVSWILAFKHTHDNGHAMNAAAARRLHSHDYERLIRDVEWKLIEDPIPRLQVLGRREDVFLYRHGCPLGTTEGTVRSYQRNPGTSRFSNLITLLPEVSEYLVRFNGVLRPLFRREWARKVAKLNDLPECELEAFLFGTERIGLKRVRQPLLELQHGHCFYCERPTDDASDVDHFLPWARYADDAIDNLVVAHPRCNSSKSDFLAAERHVVRWRTRQLEHDADLDEIARHAEWERDSARTLSVATALYLGLPDTARLWQGSADFVDFDRTRISDALGVAVR